MTSIRNRVLFYLNPVLISSFRTRNLYFSPSGPGTEIIIGLNLVNFFFFVLIFCKYLIKAYFFLLQRGVTRFIYRSESYYYLTYLKFIWIRQDRNRVKTVSITHQPETKIEY